MKDLLEGAFGKTGYGTQASKYMTGLQGLFQ